jgi:hypothetical protein
MSRGIPALERKTARVQASGSGNACAGRCKVEQAAGRAANAVAMTPGNSVNSNHANV